MCASRHLVRGSLLWYIVTQSAANATASFKTFPITELEDNKLEVVWQCNSLPAHAADQYGFTTFAMQLNELDPEQTPHLPCTDSRFRPDIRFLEQGNVDAAEAEKNRVEQMQRDRRQALAKEGREWTPQYFERVLGDNGEETYVYRGNYWKQQERRDVKLW